MKRLLLITAIALVAAVPVALAENGGDPAYCPNGAVVTSTQPNGDSSHVEFGKPLPGGYTETLDGVKNDQGKVTAPEGATVECAAPTKENK